MFGKTEKQKRDEVRKQKNAELIAEANAFLTEEMDDDLTLQTNLPPSPKGVAELNDFAEVDLLAPLKKTIERNITRIEDIEEAIASNEDELDNLSMSVNELEQRSQQVIAQLSGKIKKGPERDALVEMGKQANATWRVELNKLNAMKASFPQRQQALQNDLIKAKATLLESQEYLAAASSSGWSRPAQVSAENIHIDQEMDEEPDIDQPEFDEEAIDATDNQEDEVSIDAVFQKKEVEIEQLKSEIKTLNTMAQTMRADAATLDQQNKSLIQQRNSIIPNLKTQSLALAEQLKTVREKIADKTTEKRTFSKRINKIEEDFESYSAPVQAVLDLGKFIYRQLIGPTEKDLLKIQIRAHQEQIEILRQEEGTIIGQRSSIEEQIHYTFPSNDPEIQEKKSFIKNQINGLQAHAKEATVQARGLEIEATGVMNQIDVIQNKIEKLLEEQDDLLALKEQMIENRSRSASDVSNTSTQSSTYSATAGRTIMSMYKKMLGEGSPKASDLTPAKNNLEENIDVQHSTGPRAR